MKTKNIFIFGIIFLVGIFFTNLVSAEVTCSKTIDGFWCGVAPDESYCDSGYGTITDPSQCSGVCCVNQGICTSFSSKVECLVNGGTIAAYGSCYSNGNPINSCVEDKCFLGDELLTVTRARCDYLAAQRGLSFGEYSFGKKEVEKSSNNPVPASLGCCVQGSSCSLKNEGNCFISGGKFNAGKSCSDNSLAGSCSQCQGVVRSCSKDHSSVLVKNKCGQVEKIENCKEFEFCDNKDGVVGCYSNECEAGGKIVLPAVDIGSGKKIIPEPITITAEMLGLEGSNVKSRQNGESWCMVSGQVRSDNKNKNTEVFFLSKPEAIAKYDDGLWAYSAGLTFHRFVCNNGKIDLEQCGGEFRDEICVTKSELNYLDWGKYSEDILYCLNDGRKLKKDGHILQAPVDLREREEAFCRENLEDKIEDCRAAFPKGSFFYQPTSPRHSPSPPIQQNQCGRCGKGFFNVCGNDECRLLDDCSFNGAGFGKIAWGCVKYAAIFEATWLTAGSLVPGSSGIGSAGSAFVNPGWGGVIPGTIEGVSGVAGPLATYGSLAKLIPLGVTYWSYGKITSDVKEARGSGGNNG